LGQEQAGKKSRRDDNREETPGVAHA
jgi:hypothetical protein